MGPRGRGGTLGGGAEVREGMALLPALGHPSGVTRDSGVSYRVSLRSANVSLPLHFLSFNIYINFLNAFFTF